MTTLFPDRSEFAKPGEGNSPLLVSFKAGTLRHESNGDGSFTVTADERRGRCTIERNDDGTRSFKWFPRNKTDTNGKIEFLLTPGEQIFSRVDTGVKEDRVFLLQSSVVESRRFFFWLQEVDASKDHEILNNVNRECGNNVAPATDEAAKDELDSVLREFGFEEGDFETAPAPGPAPAPQQRPVAVPLNFVLTNDRVKALIEKPEVQEELLSMLPEGMQTAEELRATLNTPQFHMALRRLSAACMSSQYNDVMSNFGLNPADGAQHLMQGNGIAAVIAALVAKAQREGGAPQSSSSSEEAAGGGGSGGDGAGGAGEGGSSGASSGGDSAAKAADNANSGS